MSNTVNNHKVKPNIVLSSESIPSQALSKPTSSIQSQQSEALLFNGIRILGIDKKNISRLSLHVEIALEAGKQTIDGPYHKIYLDIKEHSVVSIAIDAGLNHDHILAINSVKINGNNFIKIKNPKSLNKAHMTFKDNIANILADLDIKDIELYPYKEAIINGNIKLCGFINKSLPKYLPIIDLPKLDQSLLINLGILPASYQDQSFKNFDIKKILFGLKNIINNASYDLIIEGKKSSISFIKNNTQFKGSKKPLFMHLMGSLIIDQQDDILIDIDNKTSAFTCSLGTYIPEAKLTIKPNHKMLDIDADIVGFGKNFHIDMFSYRSAKEMMPRRRLSTNNNHDEVKHNDDYNTSLGAKNVKINAGLKAKLQFDPPKMNIKGSLLTKVNINDPYVKTLERGLALNGSIATSLNVDNFAYHKENGLQALGKMDFFIDPSDATMVKFPELKSTLYPYHFHLIGDGKGAINPPEYGLSRFIRPIYNFEGHNERINNNLTKIYPIGSINYLSQIEKITAAKMRHAHQVKLLIDGINSMPERLKLIREAKDYICLQTLVFKEDDSGWQIAHALVEAQKRGVSVYCIIDSLGSVESYKDLTDNNSVLSYMKNSDIKLHIYNSFLVDGIREIFGIIKKYPSVFTVDINNLKTIDNLMLFFKEVLTAAFNESGHLSKNDCILLKRAIHKLLDGKAQVSTKLAREELWEMVRDNIATLEELLSIIKRIAHASYRWHEKYLVADHSIAIVGGMNIADEYLQGGSDKYVNINGKVQPAWRDTDVLIKGEAAIEAYQSFRRNWFHVTNEMLKSPPKMMTITNMADEGYHLSLLQHRPLEDGDHKVVNFLLYTLRSLHEGERAWFQTAYFLPRGILRVLQHEMILAAKRGVDVRLITNSEKTSDFSPLVSASIFDIRELLKAKARVFFRNDDRMVHAKVMVLGEKLTLVGSWNIDNRSAAHDSECVACIYNQDINHEMVNVLMSDMANFSDEIFLKDIEHRKLDQEIQGAAMLLAGELV